jgi:hypothetical protein
VRAALRPAAPAWASADARRTAVRKTAASAVVLAVVLARPEIKYPPYAKQEAIHKVIEKVMP